MRIGRYEDVVPFFGRENFFQSSDRVLIRLSPGTPDTGVPPALLWEVRLLRTIESPYVPRPVDLGYDSSLKSYFHILMSPGPLSGLVLAGAPQRDCIQLLISIAKALKSLHDTGVAYRNFHPKAFALTSGTEPLLYDFETAARFDPSRMVSPRKRRTKYDPPESVQAEYDGVRSDIFGLGMFIREASPQAGLSQEPVDEVVRQMTAPEPRDRPSSMARVIEMFEAQLTREVR